MAQQDSDSSNFKVVDRRSFTTDGARREDAGLKEEQPEASRAPRRAATPSPRAPAEADLDLETPGFDMLVSYLSTTAMFQLGLIPGPSGERIPSDLPNAQRTIDLLEVLQQKTQGNLTPEETQLLDDVLYQLRMTFIELDKRRTQKGK